MVDNLKNEAEALRKEKKRSQVSCEKAEFLIYRVIFLTGPPLNLLSVGQ